MPKAASELHHKFHQIFLSSPISIAHLIVEADSISGLLVRVGCLSWDKNPFRATEQNEQQSFCCLKELLANFRSVKSILSDSFRSYYYLYAKLTWVDILYSFNNVYVRRGNDVTLECA